MVTNSYQVIIAVVGFLASTKVAGDCERGPTYFTREVLSCCKAPRPNWNAFVKECSNDGKSIEHPPSPCTFECIFKVSGSIQNGVASKPKALIMLSKLFSDKDFVDAFLISFDKCEPLMKRKFGEFRESGKSPAHSTNNIGHSKCSPIYMYLALCLRRQVFMDCPAHAWIASAFCAKVKEQGKVCNNQTDMSSVRAYKKNSNKISKVNKQHHGGFEGGNKNVKL